MTVKEKILQIFENNTAKEFSGQELADKIGVSRTAVWKAINSLNEDGYTIEADKAQGYRLIKSGDYLSAENVRSHLPENMKENEIIVLKTVDSTNTYAKKLTADGKKSGTVVIAETQTAGRGRRGNSFYSPDKTGLYMTVILRPEFFTADADLVTICAGCAVCRAIESMTEKTPLIKWVNDIYLNGKKICGILSEATADFEARTIDSIVVGIGINITTADFPNGLETKAGQLGAPVSRAALAAKIYEFLFLCLDRTREENIEDYKSHSLVLNKKISFIKNNVSRIGKAIDITPKGELVVETENEVMILNSGEISIIPIV